MKTKEKLSAFLGRFLNIYTFITVLIVFIIVILANIPFIKSPIEAQQFPCGNECPSFAPVCENPFISPGGRVYGPMCVMESSGIECPVSNPVDCRYPERCNNEMRSHLKPGQTVVCVPDGNRCGLPSMGYCSVGSASGCLYGLNPTNCGCDMSACESKCQGELENLPPEVTYHTYIDTCNNCNQIFMCECSRGAPPPEPEGCPYTNTQARVQEDRYHDWQPNITINVGESFRIGSFHDGTGQFVSDTRLEVTGPSNFQYSCDTSSSGCNGHTVDNVSEGTYILTVRTHDPDGGFYPESECNATARVTVESLQEECGNGFIDPGEECDPPGNTSQCDYGTCQPDCTCPFPQRSFDIVKRVVGPTSYEEGDTVTFEVIIRNTGQVTIDTMYFRDDYDASHLRFSTIAGRRDSGSHINLRNVINPYNPTGYYEIADLTEHLGDLASQSNYVITETYIALDVNTDVYTCNYAMADWNGITHEDEACITITPRPEPPTDI